MTLRGLLAPAAAVLLAAACGDDTSAPAGTGGAGVSSGAGVTPQGWIGGQCGECFSAECAGEIVACNADPGCAATYTCMKTCGAARADGPADPACTAACAIADSSTARQAVADLEACRLAEPGTERGAGRCAACGADEPPVCEPRVPPTSCSLCLERECCETVGPYRANLEAVAFNDCLLDDPCGATFAECVIYCAELHPFGLADWGSNLGCATTRCLGEDNCEDPGTVTDPCVACTAERCEKSYRACYDNPQCVLYDACYYPCVVPSVDQACIEACDAAFPPSVVALFNTYTICAISTCEGVCAGD